MTTKKQAHTPGPLKVERIQTAVGANRYSYRISAKAGGVVAWAERKADADLFAAAPDAPLLMARVLAFLDEASDGSLEAVELYEDAEAFLKKVGMTRAELMKVR